MTTATRWTAVRRRLAVRLAQRADLLERLVRSAYREMRYGEALHQLELKEHRTAGRFDRVFSSLPVHVRALVRRDIVKQRIDAYFVNQILKR